MKTLSYLLTAALCLGMTACMDKDYDIPDFSGGSPYGNNNIEATNVVTISQLKQMFGNYMGTDFRDATRRMPRWQQTVRYAATSLPTTFRETSITRWQYRTRQVPY